MKKNKSLPSKIENNRNIDDFSEEKIIKKSNKKFFKYLFIASSVIIIIFLIASIISIYQFFYSFHPHAGYLSLAIIIILLIIFIIKPVMQALLTPCFSLDISKSNKSKLNKINYRKLKKVAKNIIAVNKNVSEESKNKLREALKKDQKTLSDTLKSIYDDEIKKDITKLTIQRASETLLATAISQNNNFDAFTTIIINIRLIMQIVVRCGYHPTYPQLAKLIIKVMRNALIAYTLQSLHLEDIVINGINKLVKGALNIIPGVNEIAKSLTQGAANALLTLRIGILTRKYLYKEYSLQEEIRSSLDNVILEDTISEADKDIDIVLTECKKAKI